LVPIAYQSLSPGLAQIALWLVVGRCRNHGELWLWTVIGGALIAVSLAQANFRKNLLRLSNDASDEEGASKKYQKGREVTLIIPAVPVGKLIG